MRSLKNLLQKKITLAKKETAGTLTERLAQVAPEALREALHLLEHGMAKRIQQQEALATTTHRILRPDAFLDWSQPALSLERCVRAMNPKPGAHGLLLLGGEEKISLKIFSASVVEEENLLGKISTQPGSFFYSKENGLMVRCGKDALLLEEVQPEGGARMSAAAFARGRIKENK